MAQEDFTTARIVNIVLGIWLFVSAFIWPHSYAQMTNTWIVGLLCVAFALIAMRVPEVRYLNTLLAVWLFISVWALPRIQHGHPVETTRWWPSPSSSCRWRRGYLGGPGSRPMSRT